MSKCVDFCYEDHCDLEETISENEYNREELKQIAAIYISNYFGDKTVPDDIDLFSPKYIDLCVDTNICDGVDAAYAAIEKSGRFETTCSEHSISEDIRFVIKLLCQIKNYAPQEFSAGILLMHLEILEGIKF